MPRITGRGQARVEAVTGSTAGYHILLFIQRDLAWELQVAVDRLGDLADVLIVHIEVTVL